MIFEIYFEKVEDAEKAGMYQKFNNVIMEHHKDFNFFSIILPEIIVTTEKSLYITKETSVLTTTVISKSGNDTHLSTEINTSTSQTPSSATPSPLPVVTTTSVIKTPKEILSDFINEIYTNKVATKVKKDFISPRMVDHIDVPVSYPVKFTVWDTTTQKFTEITI